MQSLWAEGRGHVGLLLAASPICYLALPCQPLVTLAILATLPCHPAASAAPATWHLTC